MTQLLSAPRSTLPRRLAGKLAQWLHGAGRMARILESNVHQLANAVERRSGLPETVEDEDADQLHAWSISSRLAATPPAQVKTLPPWVRELVTEAQELHPRMALGAWKREHGDQQP